MIPEAVVSIAIPDGAKEILREGRTYSKGADRKRVSVKTGVLVPTGRYRAEGESLLGVDYSVAKSLGVSNAQIQKAKDDASFRAVLIGNIALLRAAQNGQTSVAVEFNRTSTVVRLKNVEAQEKSKLARRWASSIDWTPAQLARMKELESAQKAKTPAPAETPAPAVKA